MSILRITNTNLFMQPEEIITLHFVNYSKHIHIAWAICGLVLNVKKVASSLVYKQVVSNATTT